MVKPEELIRNDIPYQRDGKIFHFILNEEERPAWSRALEDYLVSNRVNLQMKRKYTYQKQMMTRDEKRKHFVDAVSSGQVIVDLASGPSGYFAPVLDSIEEDTLFIATDACPSVLQAHAKACRKENFYLFDTDLDRELPFRDESIDVFCGNLLNNVNNYDGLIREAYRCLKPGGKFCVIEMFFDQASVSYKSLKDQKKIWASPETYADYCHSLGFDFTGSDILLTRRGKFSEVDYYPLDENDMMTIRTMYFEKN